MADKQHIGWLLEGREKWNARRQETTFTPDFSDEDLYEEFRKKGKLTDDRYIPLADFDLQHANFARSRLSDPSTGQGADLRSASLHSADLRGARLHHAKLGGAHLVSAILEDADLSSADLEGADLTCAMLVGTNLSYSKPWTATLFLEPELPSPSVDASPPPKITRVANLLDYLDHCSAIHDKALADRQFYFRGEPKDCWSLRPYVMRRKTGVPPLRAHEGEMLLELMSRRPEDFASTPGALAQWVLAQHHGLPTRLLDITRNPLVALLGACGELASDRDHAARAGRVHVFSVPRERIKPFTSDTVAIISTLAKLSRPEQDCLLGWTWEEIGQRNPGASLALDHGRASRRLYHLIRQERPHFMEAIDPRDFYQVFVVEPLQSFERIRAQSGAFLISAFHEQFESEEVLKYNSGIPVYDHVVLEVPSASKTSLVRELSLLDVTRERLLPGLDEAAKAIIRQFTGTPPPGPKSGDPCTAGDPA